MICFSGNVSGGSLLLLLAEQQFIVALGSRLGPCFRYELPVVVGFSLDSAHLFDSFHQVIALVALAAVDNSAVQTVLWNAGTASEKLTATVATIAVDGYIIPFLLVERLVDLLMCRIFTFSPSGLVTSTS